MDPQVGHCGPPLESVMIKLVDIPEMGYYAKDGKGEVSINYWIDLFIYFILSVIQINLNRFAVRVQL